MTGRPVTRLVFADQLPADAVRATLDGEPVVVVRAGLPKGDARDAVARVLHPDCAAARPAAAAMPVAVGGGPAVQVPSPTLPLPVWRGDETPGLDLVQLPPKRPQRQRRAVFRFPLPLTLAVIVLLAVAVPPLIMSARVFTEQTSAVQLTPDRQPAPASRARDIRHHARRRRHVEGRGVS